MKLNYQNIFLFLSLFLVGYSSYGQIYYVDAARPNNSGAGTSWATAKRDLQEAINAASYGSQIWVKKGTYNPTKDQYGNLNPTNSNIRHRTFTLKNGVKVYGGFAGNETTLSSRDIALNITILSGDLYNNDVVTGSGPSLSIVNIEDNSFHVIVCQNCNNTTLLDGFTIRGGYANAQSTSTTMYGSFNNKQGAGMFIKDADINVANCIFKNNYTFRRGGGLNISGNCQNTISDCVFEANRSGAIAAGMAIGSLPITKSTIIYKCKFLGNVANTDGAGITILNISAQVTDCFFSNNYAFEGGGGVAVANYVYPANIVKITKAAFVNNTALEGAGVYITEGNCQITNAIFTGNTATTAGGGGIICKGNIPTSIINCTFYKNVAPLKGAAITYLTAAGGVINNCILWNNTGIRELGSDNTTGSKVTINNSIIKDATGSPLTLPNVNMGTGNLNSYPIFANLSSLAGPDGRFMTVDDGLQLQDCSPAINSGKNTYIPAGITTDIKDDGRIQLSTVDMGAYESYSNTPGISSAMASTYTSITLPQTLVTFYVTNCLNNVAAVIQTGSNPINGSVTAKVWIENTQNAQFVKRHYEITPANNAANATGRVLLYFTQQEFDDFNAVNAIKLPMNANDVQGKANLLIEKRGGTSSNGTGLPDTYTGSIATINPADNNIGWNANNNRWEVTFNVAGFSGFFVKTSASVLPLNWLLVTGNINAQKQAVLNWKVQENNVAKYEVEKSTDGISFVSIGAVNSKGDGTNSYSFTDVNGMTGTGFYRIKQTDWDGKYSYSIIIRLSAGGMNSILSVYPNPVHDNVSVTGATVGNVLKLMDLNGKLLQTIKVTQPTFSLDVSRYSCGIYLLQSNDGTIVKMIKQ
ncbi:MAG: choice-of-anchor Q domain-containing protein [Ferruginibacter sp.]